MKVPFIDFKRQSPKMRKEIKIEVGEVLDSGRYILGEKVEEFEKKFAEYCKVKYALGVNNGTSALLLALLALDLKEGDEVITQPNTFVATVEAIVFAGAKPVLVDIDPKTQNLDTEKLKRAITKKTKVILPVHLFGQPSDMNAILRIAKKHKLFVVEDAAQAHGAEYNGKKVGSFGDMGCFRFYPTKVLGACGEGGMVTTNSKKLAEKMKILRDHGSEKKYYHSEIGFNFRMSGIQGAVLGVKLNYLKEWIISRRNKAKIYNKLFKDCQVSVPFELKSTKSSYYVYVIRVKDRERLQGYLSEQEIGTMIHYPVPIHLQLAFKFLKYKKGDFPEAESAAEEILSLPFFPEIELAEQKYVVQKIKEFYQ